jgi:hypothetical protein
LVIFTLVSLAACTGGGEDEGGTSGGPSPVDLEAARATLAGASLDDETSIDAVQGLRYTQEGVQVAREALDSGVTGDGLWAATWVYATSGTDPAPLVPLLTNEDPSIRLMAAGGLVGLGDDRGFDVLVALLTVDEQVAGSHPPVRMWQYVAATLEALTGVDLGPAPDASPEEIAVAASAWSDWLEANRAKLSFDEASATWSVG